MTSPNPTISSVVAKHATLCALVCTMWRGHCVAQEIAFLSPERDPRLCIRPLAELMRLAAEKRA